MVITPIIFQQYGWRGFATQQLRFHLLRGTIGLSSMACFFYILGRMNFTEAILLKLTTPFFIPLVALVWLREDSSKMTLLTIFLGFAGVIFIIDPTHKGWTELDLVAIGLLAAALAAIAQVSIRRMGIREPAYRIVFYFSVIGSALSWPFAWSAWRTPTGLQLFMLVLLAAVATAGQLLITAAYRRAPAGKLGQYTYSSVVFSALLGWYLWREPFTLSIALGCLFIVGAGLLNMKTK